MVDMRLKQKDRSWRMWSALFVCLLLLGVTGCGKTSNNPPTQDPPANTTTEQTPTTQAVTLKEKTFKLELALDYEAIVQGLSDRKEIADDGGMLFVLEQSRRASFVMRRCYVPIDLIYLDEQGYVDSTWQMQVIEPIGSPQWHDPSKGYPSAGAVRFVIELKGGTLDTLGLKRGDRVDLPYEKLISMAQ